MLRVVAGSAHYNIFTTIRSVCNYPLMCPLQDPAAHAPDNLRFRVMIRHPVLVLPTNPVLTSVVDRTKLCIWPFILPRFHLKSVTVPFANVQFSKETIQRRWTAIDLHHQL